MKSFGVDCLLDGVAREIMRRSLLRPDSAGGGPRTQLPWKPAAREIAREGQQTFPCLRLENIKSHDSTLSTVNGECVCVAGGAASAARCASSAQPLEILAVHQNNGRQAEADGRSQRQAKQHHPHVTLPLVTGGSASGLSATGACICCVFWPVMADAAPCSWDCPGSSTFAGDRHGTLGALARTA